LVEPKITTKSVINIQGKNIGSACPVYFIADIASNHDGDIDRAKDLIRLAKRAGADAAKFQHFAADTIVSDRGFKGLGKAKSHQAAWDRSVFEVYKAASIDRSWTDELKRCCNEEDIAFFTSPYSLDLVDHVDPFVPAYKIGSGDITWSAFIEYVAKKGKPLMLATGAANMDEVKNAVSLATAVNKEFVLMQCNTNYTGDPENFKYINLNVLKTYGKMYPGMILGLSDHTRGHATVLGAIALGAKVIEKHFTDDTHRIGPDHNFAVDPAGWREMVDRTRELESALGGCKKTIEDNEYESAVIQRRGVYLKHNVYAGQLLQRNDLIPLRPCPTDTVSVAYIDRLEGRVVNKDLLEGEALKWIHLK
jgi:sialic acid synthase SpsE